MHSKNIIMEQTTNKKILFSKMTYQEKIFFLDNLTPENKNHTSKMTDQEKIIFFEKITTEDEKTEVKTTEVKTTEVKTKSFAEMTKFEKGLALKERSKQLAKRSRQLLAPETKINRKKRGHRLIMLGFVLLNSMGKTDLDDETIKIADAWDAKIKEKRAKAKLKEVANDKS